VIVAYLFWAILYSLFIGLWVEQTLILLSLFTGTPLSYSTAEQDNEFAITDCNGFVVYVAGAQEVTDVNVADGLWHHVVVTWSSDDGVWNIHKDGRRLDGGTGLAKGRRIQGWFYLSVYEARMVDTPTVRQTLWEIKFWVRVRISVRVSIRFVNRNLCQPVNNCCSVGLLCRIY